MRVILNASVVLMCGMLAGISSLARSVPTQAAVLPAASSPSGGASSFLMQVKRSGGIEAHFEAANTTHDGRLTRDQAEKADWPRVVRHFDEIDTDHRGWITAEQIHAFNRSHRAHRRGTVG